MNQHISLSAYNEHWLDGKKIIIKEEVLIHKITSISHKSTVKLKIDDAKILKNIFAFVLELVKKEGIGKNN